VMLDLTDRTIQVMPKLTHSIFSAIQSHDPCNCTGSHLRQLTNYPC
jgi:hypothetical protein